MGIFFQAASLQFNQHPTKRAPDWRVRAAFFGIFLALSFSALKRYLISPTSR
jgi:hypothetical protein